MRWSGCAQRARRCASSDAIMKRHTFLSRISILNKLMLSSMGVLICACLVVSSFLISNTSRLLHENADKRSDLELAAITGGYTQTLTQQYDVLQEIASSSLMTNFLEAAPQTSYRKYLAYTEKIMPWLSALRNANPTLDMKIYMDSDYQSVSSVTGGKLSHLAGTSWWNATSRSRSEDCVAFTYGVVNEGYTNAMVYYHNVYDAATGMVKRVVTVSQSCEHLTDNIHVQDAWYYLISSDGQVFSSNDREALGLRLSALARKMNLEEGSLTDGTIITIEEEPYLIRAAELDMSRAGLRNGWMVLYLQPYGDVQWGIRYQIFRCALICGLVMLAALGIAVVISNNITVRLKHLMDRIDVLASGDFTESMVIDGADEISRISRQFDSMRVRVHGLMQAEQRFYRERLEAERNRQELIMMQRDMEYQALWAQINPHYLFNTLESIRMSLLLEQNRESARIMRIFAETIRRYMETDRMTATLEEELRYLHRYIEIQTFRMGDRLRYVEHVDGELLNTEIPCLILQPLVENAIDHGVDPSVSGGTVTLDIRREGEWMVVQVTDDGVGMNEERLEQVRRQIRSAPTDGKHLGLRNIDRRLVLLFGESEGLRIDSRENRGTSITVRFILSKGDEA